MQGQVKTNSPTVAVVSGGSSGIGKAFVAALHARGYAVVTCGRDSGKLRQLEAEYPGVEGHVVDVSDAAAMRQFSDKVLSVHPKIDLLISNAGGLREIDFLSENLQNLDLTAEIRSNLDGAIYLISGFLPGLRRATRASIIIVSSGYALAPATRAPIYSASKAALHSLSKSLRRQLSPLNITVTEIAPPVVDTPAVAHRNVAKMDARQVAEQALSASAKGVKEVYPGQARWLAVMLRIAPSLAEAIVAKS
ncbi:MAG: SDR family NAD(P)-dependent oxidoreductase [Beijerinckiaceae bacterium]